MSAYLTNGCLALPNPLPANHTAFWVPGVQTETDDDLVFAWNMTGPLVRTQRMCVLSSNLSLLFFQPPAVLT